MVVVALLQPPSWQMHFDPRPGVQSAVSGANIFVCLSVGVCAVCAVCPIMSVCVCVCAIMRSAIHGVGARTNAHNTISAAAPEETANVYMDQVTDPEQGFHADSAWNFFQEACGMFSQRAFCVSRSRLLSVSDHHTCVEKIPGSEEQKRLCVSIEMVLAEGRRPIISQFSC